VSHFSEIS